MSVSILLSDTGCFSSARADRGRFCLVLPARSFWPAATARSSDFRYRIECVAVAFAAVSDFLAVLYQTPVALRLIKSP